MSLTKNPRAPKQKIFFRAQTRRLVSFELFSSSLPLLAPEFHLCKATWNPVVLAWKP